MSQTEFYEIKKLILEQREKLEVMVDLYSEKLNELSTQSNGLLTEEIRNSDFYKFHKKEYDKHFYALREFNKNLTNKQKKSLRNMKRGN